MKSLTKIEIEQYPGAFNPSLIDTPDGLLLTFRWIPDPLTPWISHVGVLLLDESLRPISQPQLLDTRVENSSIPPQSEDARVFHYQGKLYIIYNDNPHYLNPSSLHRRNIYIAQLFRDKGQFILSQPLKLYHQEKYFTQKWQKNWVPFEWQGALLMSYSLIPHEVLYTDCLTGESVSFVTSSLSNKKWKWNWGTLRGGTPAMLVNGEYLAFFHSSLEVVSLVSNGNCMHHYYMGAYTFSSEPPFEITKMTPMPLIAEGFYTSSPLPKRVIFPGGYVIRDTHFYLAYGKDDQEIWIASINKQRLKELLVPLSLLE